MYTPYTPAKHAPRTMGGESHRRSRRVLGTIPSRDCIADGVAGDTNGPARVAVNFSARVIILELLARPADDHAPAFASDEPMPSMGAMPSFLRRVTRAMFVRSSAPRPRPPPPPSAMTVRQTE